jgi:SRSO17 transposase
MRRGVYSNITFPLSVKVFKPKGTLKEGDKYKTKIDKKSEMITELIEEGFNIELVLADSLYGESSQFIKKLDEYNRTYATGTNSGQGCALPRDNLNQTKHIRTLGRFNC